MVATMVEVTPSVKSSTSGFSIESIISKDSSSISSSPASVIHCPTFAVPSPDLLAASAGEPHPSLPASHHSSVAMDVLTGVRNGFGLPSPHHHLPAHHAVHHPHQHLFSAADSSLFTASKPMYSPLSAGAGCGLPALDGGHSALFGQGLSPFHGMGPEHGLSALHALSQKGLGSAASLGLSPTHTTGHLGMGMARHQFPLYTWLSRPGAYFHRYTGSEPSFLLPFRKPKRIRTAFSPSQLLRLEHAFEKNHYVVGQERKDLAINLSLTETQVKVWFQNRRTKHKRVKSEEEQETKRKDTKSEDGSQ